MLGYSDSAKEVGALSSRYLIAHSMVGLSEKIRAYGITPRFFHGSGGSVARGGGNLKDQIAWWATSAIEAPK
ncbi:phosphoenolpyruvate carboxylase, partial [Proteus mirabilis]